MTKAYHPRAQQLRHNGQINLYAIVPFENLFLSKAGTLWSTAREGLRQRKWGRWKGFTIARVSWKGQTANWLASSLMMLAHGHDWRVHWDGTRIVNGWINTEQDPTGDAPSAKIG
jgi:hypothetical protein